MNHPLEGHVFSLSYVSDWSGVYIDGKLVTQGHSIDIRDFIEQLGGRVVWIETDEQWLENDAGEFPENLHDVKTNDNDD